MKKSLFTLTFVFIFPFLSPAQISSNGTGGGAWNSSLTWAGGLIPTSSDDVIIETGDVVTVSSTQSCYSITVNGLNASSYGTLSLQTGAQLSTSGHTTVYGKLYLMDGIFNEGNSSGDKLIINGTNLASSCLISISGGTLNVSRYFALSNSSSFEMTGGKMNVNSSGGSSSTDIFYIPSGTTFTMSSGTINILNGNLGSGVAIKFNPTTSNVTGGTIKFTNLKNYASTTLICNNTLYDISCDVTSGNKLIIQNMPSSANGFECHNFNITSGSVQIDPGYGMTIGNSLTNNDSLIIASDATGNGSLIVGGTPSGNVTVQLYIPAYISSSDGWHLLSTAFDADPSGTSFDPRGTNNDLFVWDEATNTWLNYKENVFTFHRGYGGLIAQQFNTTNSISGTLFNSDFTVNNQSYTPGVGDGWHLMGNPFTSAIKWNDGNWTLTNVGTHAEIYDESAGNYIVLNANDIIPSSNGFFIQVSNSSNTLTIPVAACTHDATVNYKNSDLIKGINLKVTGDANSFFDATQIQFLDNATEKWDVNLDAHKISGANTAPQLWTVSNNEDYALNSLPIPKENVSIPVGFKAGVNSTYHLAWTGMENMDSNLELLLEDKLEGNTINMRDVSSYDFNATTDDITSRFTFHINGTNSIHETSDEKALVYAMDRDVYIKTKKNLNLDGCVRINNLLGQLVYCTNLNGTTQQIIRTQLNSGVYIVRMEMKDGTITTQKVIIK